MNVSLMFVFSGNFSFETGLFSVNCFKLHRSPPFQSAIVSNVMTT